MEKEISDPKQRWALAAISFIFVAFGQPAWIAVLAPVAAACGYALFWKTLLVIPSFKRRFWFATAWYFGVQAIQLSWMTSFEYQGYYILFFYLFLAAGLGIQFGLLSLFVPVDPLTKLGTARILAIASVWTLMEWMRLYFLCGFSFNQVGMALSSFTLPLQLAAIGGIFGLSFWVMMTNLFALKAFCNLKNKKALSLWGVLALFPYFFGFGHVVYHDQEKSSGHTVSATLVQTALLPAQKVPIEGRMAEFIPPIQQWKEIFTLLKAEKDEKTELIVLPEIAVPFQSHMPLYSQKEITEMLGQDFYSCVSASKEKMSNACLTQALANYFNAEVIMGLETQEEAKSYNAVFHFAPHSQTIQRYEKRVLLPLAEYLPWEWLRPLVKYYGINDFFSPGTKAKIFFSKLPISASICYEEMFSDLMREGRQEGGSIFVNVTNDNWYPSSRLFKQHLHHAKVRAIENGVPLLRACNSGVTAIIDSLGRIRVSLEEGKMGVLNYTLDVYHYKTIYTFCGDKGVVILCFVFLIVFWFFRFVKKPSQN